MKKPVHILLIIGSTSVLLCSILAARAAMGGQAMAQFPTGTPQDITPTALTPTSTLPPALTQTPTEQPVLSRTPTATLTQPPRSTNTPLPTNTNTPTQMPAKTPTSTPSPTRNPANTPVIPPTAAPTQPPRPTDGGPPPSTSRCQSFIEGTVFSGSGQTVTGATVTIQGEDWSSGLMTDDQGRYAFAGLCAGTAVLQAFLPNGGTSAAMSVTLTGENSIQLDLMPDLGGTGTAASPTTATAGSTEQPGDTEAEMPVTGFSGWLLAGGAGLAALLLLSAGARRTLRSRNQARGQD